MSDGYEYTDEGMYGERTGAVLLPPRPHLHDWINTPDGKVCRPRSFADKGEGCGRTYEDVAAEHEAMREKVRELEGAFGPEATIEGHVRRLWEIRGEMRKLDGEAGTLQRILDEHMQTTAEAEIRVEGAPLMHAHVTGYRNGRPVVVARFEAQEWGRCRRCRSRGRELKGGICGNCGDDLRQDAEAYEASLR